MVYLDRGQGRWTGGGAGGLVVPVAAAALAGWAAWDLFALSVVLAAGVGIYAVVAAIFYHIVSDHYAPHSSVIKILLVTSMLAAAAVDLSAFKAGFLRFIVVDVLVLLLFAGGLVLGLWGLLSLFWRAVALAMLVILIVAPFTEIVERNEKWMIRLSVRDETCVPVRSAETRCELISSLTGDVVGSAGPQASSEFGAVYFTFNGSPRGKVARCTANKNPFPSGTTTVEPGWIGATEATIRLLTPDRPASTECDG